MPINMSARRGKRKQLTVEYDGEACDIWYRPSVITPRLMREMESAADAGAADRIMDQIERFVAEWDVIDDSGNRLPVTAEVMGEFELPFLVAVLSAVTGDMYPEKPIASGSFAG